MVPLNEELENKLAALRARGDMDAAADALVRGYGPEIHSYLSSRVGVPGGADDAFSLFSEDVWRGLKGFEERCAYRTWAYCIARRAAARLLRGELAQRDRFSPDDSAAQRAAAYVKSTTAVFKRTETKNQVRALREQLTEEEQELLVLRIDRGLDWREIAVVTLEEERPSDEQLTRAAAAARKRFERTKEKLASLARDAGLLGR